MLIELKFLNKKRVKLWEEGKIMGTFASTGAFSTLKSNMGMLNTKKAKMFLINKDLVRFKGNNIKTNETNYRNEDYARVRRLMKQPNDSEYHKKMLILAISVLSTLLIIATLSSL